MSKNTKKNQQTGHPAKKDPAIARLAKLQVEVVRLTQELAEHHAAGLLTDDQYWNFKGAAFGLMDTYAVLTGKPRPDSQTNMDFDEFMAGQARQRELEESMRRHPAGKKKDVHLTVVEEGVRVDIVSPPKKRQGAEANLIIVDETPLMTRTCERCHHMGFNHRVAEGRPTSCSFSNCPCDDFV